MPAPANAFDREKKTNNLACCTAMTSVVFALLLIIVGACGLSWSKTALRTKQLVLADISAKRAPLYLPSVRYVKLVTLGFNHFFSNILWFNTLNYFGAHYDSDKDYRWLGHMCELVTDLDNQARHVYESCATLLSWVAKEPQKSTQLLTKAIEVQPQYWRLRYLRGFNYWYFLGRTDLAEVDLRTASALEGAPSFLASLASRLIVSREDPNTAIAFLQDIIRNTNDKTAKKALKGKLRRAKISRDIKFLEGKIAQYETDHPQKVEHLNQLIEAGLLEKIPLDPYGSDYFFDQQTGEIKSKSGKRGLEFFGKTAESGLAKGIE
jgi:hypothetical protein